MTNSKAARGAQVWQTKWTFVPTMNQHADMRKHLCVVLKVEGDVVTLMPTSTKPVEGRTNQRSIGWGGCQVYAATNRVFTVDSSEWVGLPSADALHQPDKEVRAYLKQELRRV